MNKATALLIDISSIQEYVFGSNKLKINIGASHIIESEVWKIGQENIEIKGDNVYIGGGNALFKFDTNKDAEGFIKTFSKNVLLYYPGLKISAAIIDSYDESNAEKFKESRQRLNREMTKNKSLYPANPILPKEGVFADCKETNEYQERDSLIKNGGKISKVAYSKLQACKRAQSLINTEIRDKSFTFTDELDKLGQQKDKGYIAVVHIDGNNIGQRFINCQSELELVKLSKKVSNIGRESMTKLTEHVCSLFYIEDGIKNEILLETEEKNDEKAYILPFRPILNGGDDITFVTEGRLGVYLAQKFIEIFEKQAIEELGNTNGTEISACAGVAIVKTKFPFFKAYQLAEELCHEAKKLSRSEKGSHLSFHVANLGVSGDLDTIRKEELTCHHGSLTANPYSISGSNTNKLSGLLEVADKLNKWPRNKAMGLRETVKKSTSDQELFKKQIEYRNLKLPIEKIWENKKTLYWDALQMLQFYPLNLLALPSNPKNNNEV